MYFAYGAEAIFAVKFPCATYHRQWVVVHVRRVPVQVTSRAIRAAWYEIDSLFTVFRSDCPIGDNKSFRFIKNVFASPCDRIGKVRCL